MKKRILIALAMIMLLCVFFTGCKEQEDINPGDPNMLYDPSSAGMTLVEDIESYDLMKKAYDSYKRTENYTMEIDFVFNADAEMVFGTLDLYQSTYQKTVRNNGNFYDYYIIAGKGNSVPTGIGREFEYNATTKESKARYINDSKLVKLDNDKKVTADFSKAKWGKFDSSKEDGIKTVNEKINKTKESFHQYNWLEDKYLSSKTDKRVYEKAGKYYCTILINTLASSVKTDQPAVVQAIEASTGGNFDRFNDDTRMMAEIEQVNGTYRFTQFILMEDYAGSKSALGKVTINASQYYWHKFTY